MPHRTLLREALRGEDYFIKLDWLSGYERSHTSLNSTPQSITQRKVIPRLHRHDRSGVGARSQPSR